MNILFVVIKLNVCHFILYYQEVNLTTARDLLEKVSLEILPSL